MSNHIEKTLASLANEINTREGEIVRIKAARAALVELYESELSPALVVAETAKAAKPAKAKKPRKAKKVKPAAPAEPGSEPAGDEPLRVGSLQHRVLVECRKLPAPFTAASVAVACSIDEKAAGNTLYILATKKLVAVTGKEGVVKLYEMANG